MQAQRIKEKREADEEIAKMETEKEIMMQKLLEAKQCMKKLEAMKN